MSRWQGQTLDGILKTLLESIELVSRSFTACTLFLQTIESVATGITGNSGRIYTFARFLDFNLQLCVTTSSTETQVSHKQVLEELSLSFSM
jgi:hypothetical protein